MYFFYIFLEQKEHGRTMTTPSSCHSRLALAGRPDRQVADSCQHRKIVKSMKNDEKKLNGIQKQIPLVNRVERYD